jgi:primosomal protein N' (replication factor Y)
MSPESALPLFDSPPDSVKRVSLGSRQQKPLVRPIPAAPYITVVPDRGQSSVDKELTYAIPEELRTSVDLGSSVLVPIGRQYLTGYVTGFTSQLDFEPQQLRAITQLLSTVPVFEEKALQVARWMSSYYHCSLSESLCCWVPQGNRQSTEKRYAFATEDWETALRPLLRSPRRLQIAQLLLKHEGALSQKEIEKEIGGSARDALNHLLADGVITEADELLDPTVKPRKVQAVRALNTEADWPTLEKAAPKQASALRKLLELHSLAPQRSDASSAKINSEASGDDASAHPTMQLAHDWGIELAALRGLEKKGLVEFVTVEQRRAPIPDLPPRDTHAVQLSEDQQFAVDTIAGILNIAMADGPKKEPEVVLLQGITASGKTEVYLHAIEKCLALGRRAVVLVPEIALTAQTVETFQRRFQERVAILHSALGAGERFDEWRRAHAGGADIVVGARSAVFAPTKDIGLIVIDEEHDGSYKQDSTPRYHARDVAIKRASLEGAVVLLGSATPSLESYQRAMRGDWSHIQMLKRVGARQLPEVEVVDMTTEAKMGSLPVLSRRMKDELCETVQRGEQAILFLNRRGFASYVQCLGCGHAEKCPNCDVSLTYHRGERSLRCHHCDHAAPVIEACPECDGWMIGFTGTGTEKVESEVAAMLEKRGFKDVSILRLDRDTTARKGSHGKILGEFRQGKAQILIGTQMVTKGLDFPNVTLVGVIAADSALNMPDFRAAERTFQLLAQVSGRAGRGHQPGRVLIQTLDPDHYSIAAATAQDYEAFVNQELEFRGSPPYPPFAHIVNIVSSDENEGAAMLRIQKLALAFRAKIDELGGGTEILGPVDCPISRVKNKYRFHLMLRDRNRPRLHKVLAVYDALQREQKAGLTVDVDASALL